jgi:hypothetical protein
MPSCKKSRGAVASECSRPGIPPTRTVRRAAFPAALSMVTTIEGLFSGANPLKVGRFPVLPQLFFASRTPALTLNSKQFEAVFVRRLPCKSGSRTPQPSREPSGFDPSKPNKTGVENLIASEPNLRLFPNGMAAITAVGFVFSNRLPQPDWVRIAKSLRRACLAPRAPADSGRKQ